MGVQSVEGYRAGLARVPVAPAIQATMGGALGAARTLSSGGSGAGQGSAAASNVFHFHFHSPVYGAQDVQDMVVQALSDAARRGRVNQALVRTA